MNNLAKAEQVREIMLLLTEEHDAVIEEHLKTPAGFFGQATAKHHELMGRSRILKKLNSKLSKIHTELMIGER